MLIIAYYLLKKMEQTTSYTTRMSAADAAEQSRIATAQGMRDIATALRERAATSPCSDDDRVSVSSSDSSERRHKRRRHDKGVTRNNDSEKQAHYLKLELANAKVDIDDLKVELAKMKAILDPYSSVNNEMAYLKSATERSNKEVHTLTFAQLTKRLSLYKEEYREHLALCNAALAKVTLAEVKSSLTRVLTVEKRRAASAEKNLEWALWVRETTFNVSVGVLISLVLCLIFLAFYWYLLRHLVFDLSNFRPWF
jgi:hypothetical protein